MAARWHTSRLGGSSQRADAEFARWLADSAENRAAYDRVTRTQDDIVALADAPEIISLRQQTLARLALRRSVRIGRHAILGILLASVAAGLPLYALFRERLAVPLATSAASHANHPARQVFQTAVGQRMTLVMADGSQVTLNTASRLGVAYTSAERRLELEQGQAWFEVAKDKTRPFVVYAGGQRVEAHGTAFDIRLKPERTEVMLARGKVTVASLRQGGGGAQVAMTPDELLVAAADRVTVRHVDPADWGNWREGNVVFQDLDLTDAVAEMNRYSPIQLRLANEATGRIRVSGVFHAGETQAFVEALATGFGVKSQSTATNTVMLRHAGH